jgi:hypothetical protein
MLLVRHGFVAQLANVQQPCEEADHRAFVHRPAYLPLVGRIVIESG